MSDSQPPLSQRATSFQTIVFMVILSLVCALILSILASALAKPQEEAKELDRVKQLLMAAKILDYNNHFLIENDEKQYVTAQLQDDGVLIPESNAKAATNAQISAIYKKRILPLLANDKGEVTTFEKANVNEDEYIAKYQKTGFYKQPLKLLYAILPSSSEKKEDEKPVGYVIPVNGFGLWDAIYGYLAIKPDGNTVIGISWYDQKETPGLGANISEAPWQSLFPGKFLFQPSADGQTNVKTAPLGIIVVKGKVTDVLGDSPKSKSAVDGMAGATLTGNGVTEAYRDVLAAYRPFLVKIHNDKKTDTDIKKSEPVPSEN